jgi:ESCRT-II complex subunit VPS36
VPSNFDPSEANVNTPLPPCLACGIKPPLAHVLRAAITAATRRKPLPSAPSQDPQESNTSSESTVGGLSSRPSASFACPACTFLNHPSLLSCEICGAALLTAHTTADSLRNGSLQRAESPGPLLSVGAGIGDIAESIKFSFRAGGEKIFYERLKGAMVQRKWLLQGATPVSDHRRNISNDISTGTAGTDSPPPERVRVIGIAGLERARQDMRRNNELVIGNAFEDLNALMASAKEIVALAEQFSVSLQAQPPSSSGGNSTPDQASVLLSQSTVALGLSNVTTKDMLNSETTYLSELARNLAEFLSDDARGVLKREGGIMSLVDLWAVFNRARGGVELVSPHDLEKAARQWEKLHLPVRLRTFKSGLLVVQGAGHSDAKTERDVLAWLRDMYFDEGGRLEGGGFGKGVTAQEAAEKFRWSVGVAVEELEMCEDRGTLCREESVGGVKFWENWIADRDRKVVEIWDGLADHTTGLDRDIATLGV